MKLSFIAATVYLAAGIASGLFYREFTKANDFPEGGATQLGVVHTHLLVLGFLVFLIVLVLDRLFGIARGPLFQWFFWTYNAGLLLTAAMMVVHGSLTVLGEASSAAIAGIAGMGHILLTIALALLMVSLGRRIFGADRAAAAPAVEEAGAVTAP
ncbi:DUF2871 family protein [uncultured Leifsonia sp.]|uniref:DUF2871 family protein n=1 Tax=uncultured Leifsonia sp. TaxID=340359 RepID=UPI0028D2A3C5|nr:DUF2871 family protein [uncultured Leifsonia sp.]